MENRYVRVKQPPHKKNAIAKTMTVTDKSMKTSHKKVFHALQVQVPVRAKVVLNAAKMPKAPPAMQNHNLQA